MIVGLRMDPSSGIAYLYDTLTGEEIENLMIHGIEVQQEDMSVKDNRGIVVHQIAGNRKVYLTQVEVIMHGGSDFVFQMKEPAGPRDITFEEAVRVVRFRPQ